MLDEPALHRILERLPRLSIAVAGDLFLDKYLDLAVKCWGKPRLINFAVMHGMGPKSGGDGVVVVNVLDQASGRIVPLDAGGPNLSLADKKKIWVPFATALYAPLVFLGGRWVALGGAALWGLGVGVHESVLAAAIAAMVPPARRATAYGLFTAAFGLFWFVGSVLLGWLYDVSWGAMIALALVLEVAAVPFFLVAARRQAS